MANSQGDLFAATSAKELERQAPLAARMRPRTLDDMQGQHNIIGDGRILRRAI